MILNSCHRKNTLEKSLQKHSPKTNEIVLKVYEAIDGANDNVRKASPPLMNSVSPNSLLSLHHVARHTLSLSSMSPNTHNISFSLDGELVMNKCKAVIL